MDAAERSAALQSILGWFEFGTLLVNPLIRDSVVTCQHPEVFDHLF